MLKRSSLLFIFFLFSCQEPAPKNTYIPPIPLDPIQNVLSVNKDFDNLWSSLLVELGADYKVKSRDIDAGELILLFDTNKVSNYINCGMMNEEVYVNYIDRIFESSLDGQINISLDRIDKNNTSIKINIKYRFVSKETGTRWSFETNKPKSILVGNPAYGLDPYRECRSSNFLESVLTETITKNHSHIK